MEHELPDFDAAYYLEQYADVAASGMDPYFHFLHFGIQEGRLGARPRLCRFTGGAPFDPVRETVLVVSHEASVTGAPILSLNLIRGLQRRYNVVSLLLGGGPLVPEFREACTISAEPLGRRHHAELANETITQLCSLQQFRFAVVNSVECAFVLEPLALEGVPTLALVHEFAAYTRPPLLFEAAFAWATELVFSTHVTHDDVIARLPHLPARPCRFIPQGRCTLLAHDLDAAREADELLRVQTALRPAGLPADTIVVIGIGSVQMRKGVELFVDCAARIVQGGQGRPFRFVWIGDGLDGERDLGYSVFLLDQIERAGLSGCFEFMRTTPLVEQVYEMADVFLLTSRLDPLPGVAIEAMSHGLPVACFDGTTGIAPVLVDYGLGAELVAPYLNTEAMAARVLELTRSPAMCSDVAARVREVAQEYFCMDAYVDALDALAKALEPPA